MRIKKPKTKVEKKKIIKTKSKTKKSPSRELHTKNSVIQWIAPEAQRKITLSSGKEGESLEVHSPDGQLEFQLVWTSSGPILKIAVAKLELFTTGEIAMNCGSFNVSALQGISMESKGPVTINSAEIRAKTTKSIHLDGEKIRLNSPEGQDKPVNHAPLLETKHDCGHS
jgi:hypothetical protein